MECGKEEGKEGRREGEREGARCFRALVLVFFFRIHFFLRLNLTLPVPCLCTLGVVGRAPGLGSLVDQNQG